jgi:hypothetical protein
MSAKTNTSANGVLNKHKRLVDPDDVLTREENALVSKARQEMREGKYFPLTNLEHGLAHKRSSRPPQNSLKR